MPRGHPPCPPPRAMLLKVTLLEMDLAPIR